MSDRIEPMSPAYRGEMIASTPGVVWGRRLQVTGLQLLPLEGPLLLVGDHDSYWDPVAAGIAALADRQIRALAKSSMWKNTLLGAMLTGMGQTPIERGSRFRHGQVCRCAGVQRAELTYSSPRRRKQGTRRCKPGGVVTVWRRRRRRPARRAP
jgi:1-acyl-sn-glycerol-3-phosphate acyltransferase